VFAVKLTTEWAAWVAILAAPLHRRLPWRLPAVVVGILLASGRWTVANWWRAAGVGDCFRSYYHFLDSLGRNGVENVSGTENGFPRPMCPISVPDTLYVYPAGLPYWRQRREESCLTPCMFISSRFAILVGPSRNSAAGSSVWRETPTTPLSLSRSPRFAQKVSPSWSRSLRTRCDSGSPSSFRSRGVLPWGRTPSSLAGRNEPPTSRSLPLSCSPRLYPQTRAIC